MLQTVFFSHHQCPFVDPDIFKQNGKGENSTKWNIYFTHIHVQSVQMYTATVVARRCLYWMAEQEFSLQLHVQV